MKPELFIATSDYATLKNDNKGTDSLTMPSSVIVGPGSVYKLEKKIAIGSAGAAERAQIESNLLGKRYVGHFLSVSRNGTVSSNTAQYSVLALVTRDTDTTIALSIEVWNPYSSNLVTANVTETFTFYINTFLPPVVI